MRNDKKVRINTFLSAFIFFLSLNLFLGDTFPAKGKNFTEQQMMHHMDNSSYVPGNNRIVTLNNTKTAYAKNIIIYVYQNERCLLPETVQAVLPDGGTKAVKVDWDDKIADTSNVEGYTIQGKLQGYNEKVNCIINVSSIDNIMNKLIKLPEGQYDKTEARAIINRLSKIYPRILERLLDNGVKVKLITTNITDLPEYAYLKGVVPRGWEGTGKTWDDVPGVSGNPIAIKIGYSERGRGHGSINLELHETAHTIDGYILNMESKTKQFEDIWKSEVKNLFPGNTYFENYPDEYFAEAFAMFYLDGNSKYELSLKAPKTFKFFENLEESFYIKL